MGKCPWEKFSQFSLDRESFPLNYGLVDQQYKSTEMLQQKISPMNVFLYTVYFISTH